MIDLDPARADLLDRIEWLLAHLRLQELRGGSDDELVTQLGAFNSTQRRILERAAAGQSFMALLQERLALTDSEATVVALLVGVELSADVRAHVLSSGPGMSTGMTIERIRTVVYGTVPSREALRELGASGRLRRFGLIERNDSGGGNTHESQQTWTVATRVLEFLLGEQEPSNFRARIVRARERSVDRLVVSQETLSAVCRAVSGPSVVLVSGLPGSGRRTLLAAAAEAAGHAVVEVDAAQLSPEAGVFAHELKAIARECKLLGRTLLLVNIEALSTEAGERLNAIGHDLVNLLDGPVLVTCGISKPRFDWERPLILIEMGTISSAQRAELWHSALGMGSDDDAAALANNYPLAPALIVRAASAARARAAGSEPSLEDIHLAIRTVLDERLGHFCKRLTVSQTWADVVLSKEHIDRLLELLARVRGRSKVYERWGFASKVGRGLGVSALFSGPPGTGKTMVAGLIARDLGLEIYQVDMAKVVSKFIGETEKNLGALFDAAEAGHAILLFDEADALFGKRTEVKSSNDRFANLETNYLLQRLESFSGICVLTSNHESHMDPAFQRRLSLHLHFELPDENERAKLWRVALPVAAPRSADIDFAALGRRYAMSGGYIRNAALRAAFVAAEEDSPITAGHLERSARVEYEGMGKIAV